LAFVGGGGGAGAGGGQRMKVIGKSIWAACRCCKEVPSTTDRQKPNKKQNEVGHISQNPQEATNKQMVGIYR